MDKYTVVIKQRKTWHGWKRDYADIFYSLNYDHATQVCNIKNGNRNTYTQGTIRYVVISIDSI